MKNLKAVFMTAALLVLVMLESGCTVALWRNEVIDSWNQPATDYFNRDLREKSWCFMMNTAAAAMPCAHGHIG
jgi:hypothetical protein